MNSKIQSSLLNTVLIVVGIIGVHILNLCFLLIIPIPELSVQSYFWNGVQVAIQLISLFCGSFGISFFSRKYAKMNTLILGSVFLILNILTFRIFWSPLIPELQYSMWTLVIFTLPSAYFGYFLSQKLLWKIHLISKK